MKIITENYITEPVTVVRRFDHVFHLCLCLYKWSLKSRRLRWAGHVASMEEGRGVLKVLVGKPVGKRPLGRPRRRWEDNINMDLEEVGRGCGDWMELAQDRKGWRALVSTGMNLRVP